MEPNKPDQSLVRRLMIFFGLVYFMQGVGQASGLVSQPLSYFFKEALGLNPAQTTEYLAILTLPWVIKPLYGLISDFIPLFGYRRKSYLFLMNAVAAAGFLWLTGLTEPGQIVTAMLLTAFGTASSDVLVDAVMVENGQATDMTKQFQATQWMWFNIAAIGTAWFGGYLCEHLSPTSALHTAAMITMFAPIAVMTATFFLVKEKKSQVNLEQLKSTGKGFLSVFKSKTLWAVVAFIAFWNFSPSFGTPFYYHMVDNLKFSQGFIGLLGMLGAIGSVIGAYTFRRWIAGRFSTKKLLAASIVLGTVSTLSNLLLVTPYLSTMSLPLIGTFTVSQGIAAALTLVFSVVSIWAMLTVLGLAADACPSQAEGFTFAFLMSVYNFAAQGSAIIGARLYTYVLGEQLTPLIWISAGFTAAAFLLFPLLRGVFRKEAEEKKGGDRK
ncbi:MAG TPA: MFS transporter, partial [Candidatus Obscuribacterales bacterium]